MFPLAQADLVPSSIAATLIARPALNVTPVENAIGETIWRELLLSNPENLEQARKMVDETVQIYNTERPHMALKNKTPDAVHRAL